MFICGVNTSSDDDHSILAFTHQTGNSNNWGDSWRGNNQYGTIWSLFNDDYKNGRGWASLQGYSMLRTNKERVSRFTLTI